ncbi:MAG: glycoside hydrolase family 2 protein [Sphaerochaetaceae bacterium]
MQTLLLDGLWRLFPKDTHAVAPYCRFFLEHPSIPCKLPGDIYTALLEQQLIEDPYWGTNELSVQWVGKNDWVMQKTLTLTREQLEHCLAILTFTMADTIITLSVNNHEIGKMDNQFRRYRFDVSSSLIEGDNLIELSFISAEKAAIEEASKLEYPIPCSVYPVSSPHRNLIRKSQCHSGWDWGPCILSQGVYQSICLELVDQFLIENVTTELRELSLSSFDVKVNALINVTKEGLYPMEATLADSGQKREILLRTGLQKVTFHFECHAVQRWWPNGEGKATLYPLVLTIADQTVTKRIGFRTIEVKTPKDKDGGRGMIFCVNGRDIYAKGANWIPQDALISRITAQRYQYLLQSCVEANMNMIRLWGGGMYEMDAFYDYCDEKGLLIWHDLMFSCSLYPSSDEFLKNVELELRYQIPRLMDHPSIALWCGNNEDLGAITWYEESKKNMARYVVDYDRLNHSVVERVVTELDPQRVFWPSSPSSGKDDFSDNWHSDNQGDMHYWTVWHEGKPFESYYDVKPRFVSEFGYQSFPSLSTVRTYAPEEQLNLTSPVMEHHQKNTKGNSIILGNFCTYFRLPLNFEQMLYLSECQQALAMKMATEYWRSLRPHCMGSLYWQLNDNWPVASWSSIDYTGKWKLLQYAARRFYSSILPLAYQDFEGEIRVYVVNDTPHEQKQAHITVKCASFSGEKQFSKAFLMDISGESSQQVCTLPDKIFEGKRQDCFLYIKYTCGDCYRENTLFLDKPKRCNLENPSLKLEVKENSKGFLITVSCLKPAFYVSLDAGPLNGTFSDNWFDVRPTAQKQVHFTSVEKLTLSQFKENLKVFDLFDSSKN